MHLIKIDNIKFIDYIKIIDYLKKEHGLDG